MHPGHPDFPDIVAVHAAAQILAPILWPTPVRPFPGRPDCFLKPENLQRTGSFKIRGAYHKVASLDPGAARRGVIAYSSGNHGQAVACAAQILGYPATIVMPRGAVAEKREAVLSYGARVIESPGGSDERRALAEEMARSQDLLLVPPYDDPVIVTGQATVGREIALQLPAVRSVFVPVGGGGLISGIAIALRALLPNVRVIGVEPAGADDARQSLGAGRHLAIAQPDTVADGLRAQTVGEFNYQVISRLVDEIVTVSEAEISEAVRLLLGSAHLVAEPSGAVAAAAMLLGRASCEDPCVAVVSGGNVALGYLREALAPR